MLRRLYVGWSWVIVAAVVVQFYLAGLYVFGSVSIEAHEINGGFIFFAALLGGIFALVAQAPWRTAGLNWGLLGLVALQVALIRVGSATGMPVITAFHVVNALAIFGLSTLLAVRSRTYVAASVRAARSVSAEATPSAAAH